ncbi:hypothetical protein B0G71_1385 [Paraburkholderia sp. BL27I4N3]|uniref:hypothetical protein n=1 Tax=Paraburkholderia sp. BL27I4N3 TaxID=1938805 RepID=UPI000E387564|nr:hypothetical protein [Paraburkholderia sp. BL27I4N3]REE18373.1 hypothetical protein B0G71_1385 [Paraburkholderia sp. BL27I4N3]
MTVLFVAFSGMLSACAGRLSPSAEVMRNADYGPYPADYRTIIERYREARFENTTTGNVQYLSVPQKSWGGFSFHPYFGYVVCLAVNAKDGFGSLKESRLTGVFIRDGQVVAYRSADHTPDGTDLAVRDMCKEVIGRFDTPANLN